MKRIDGRVEGFHTPIYLPIPKRKQAILCSKEWRLRTRNICPSVFRRWQRLFLYALYFKAQGSLTAQRQARSHRPTLQPQSDRMNMPTQEPKKQNLSAPSMA